MNNSTTSTNHLKLKLIVATENLIGETKKKLDSYQHGYNLIKMLEPLSAEDREVSFYIAAYGELCSEEYYNGMLARLLPSTTLYLVG